jgi:GTP-binding protein
MAAEPGVSGGIDNCEGKNAQHRIVDVPPGTIFRNLEREIVAEVVEEGSMFIAARGGGGGKGNAFFKTAQRQTPLVAEKGGQGETFTFDIGK